jgi:hypothetical protein
MADTTTSNKIEIKFEMPKSKTITYNGVTITVVPFLTPAQQTFLISRYLNDYFAPKREDSLVAESPYNYLEAEYSLRNYLLQGLTNINAEKLDNNIYGDSTFWHQITGAIENYDYFRYSLDYIVKEVKAAKENTLAQTFKEFFEKIEQVIQGLASITPEEIEKAGKENEKLLEELKKSSILSPKNPIKKQ